MNNLYNFYNQPINKQTPINPVQFQQGVVNLSQDTLQQLAAQARAQGISDKEIEEGMNFIKNLALGKAY